MKFIISQTHYTQGVWRGGGVAAGSFERDGAVRLVQAGRHSQVTKISWHTRCILKPSVYAFENTRI